ncbi:MAG: hypothetical protein WCF33_16170 [Pseudonocardiaceae bacterium]
MDKPGGFLGRDALLAARERGVTRRLRCLTLDDPRTIVVGGEPVRVSTRVAVETAGRRIDGVVNAEPLHDPKGVRTRAGT